MKPVMTTAKARKAHSFMRSATAPETMDMAVATNTTWKKKSDAAEYTEPPSKPASEESASTPARSKASMPLKKMPPSYMIA